MAIIFEIICSVALLLSASLLTTSFTTTNNNEADEHSRALNSWEYSSYNQLLSSERNRQDRSYLLAKNVAGKGSSNTPSANLLDKLGMSSSHPSTQLHDKGREGDHPPLTHRPNDMNELEDAATSDSWTQVQTGSNWQCITSDSYGINLVAGSRDSGIFYSNNGGDSWAVSTGGIPTMGTTWYAVASSSSGKFVVAGCGNQGQLWTSIDYGISFAVAASYGAGLYIQYGGLAMASNRLKIIAAVNGLGVILYNLNMSTGKVAQIGNVTHLVKTNVVNSATSVSSNSNFTILTFGVNSGSQPSSQPGGIFYTSNGGSTTPKWTLSNAPNVSISWYGITSSANGQYLAACTQGKGIYYSQDSGATWIQSSSNAPIGINMNIYGISSSVSGKTMAAAVSSNGNNNVGYNIYLSYDYGKSWNASDSPTSNWYGVAMVDDGGTIYGINDQGIYKSYAAPSSQPSSQPSLQPTTYPTYDSNDAITVDIKSETSYSPYIQSYSVSHTLTNIGVNQFVGDNNYYLVVNLAGTSLSSNPLSFQVSVGKSNTLIGICDLVFHGCDIDKGGDVAGGDYNYLCLINEDVTSYIESEKGGSLNVTTTVTNFDNPCNSKVVVCAQYVLQKGRPFPTQSPTLSPVQPAINGDFNIHLNGSSSLYAMIFIAGMYACAAVLLLRIRETKIDLAIVYPAPFIPMLIKFVLLGINLSSETSFLVKLVLNAKFHREYFVLAAIISVLRLLQILPSLYFQKHLVPARYQKLLVRGQMMKFAIPYGALLMMSLVQIQFLLYLPWKSTWFSRRNNGFPDLFLFNLVNYFELTQLIVSVSCQMVYGHNLTVKESFQIDNIFLVFSITSSLILILINIFKLYARAQYVENDAKEVDKLTFSHGKFRISSSNSSKEKDSSSASAFELTNIESGSIGKISFPSQFGNMSEVELIKEIDERIMKKKFRLERSEREEDDLRLHALFELLQKKTASKNTAENINRHFEMHRFADKAYDQMIQVIPYSIFSMSPSEMLSAGITVELAHRLFTKQCLWLLRVYPADLESLLTEESVRTVYEVTTDTGLDITELGALYCVASDISVDEISSSDSGNGSSSDTVDDISSNPMLSGRHRLSAVSQWKFQVESLFENMYTLYENGDLHDNQTRNSAYNDDDDGFGGSSGMGGYKLLGTKTVDKVALLRWGDINKNSSKSEDIVQQLSELQTKLERKDSNYEKEMRSQYQIKQQLEEKNRALEQENKLLEKRVQDLEVARMGGEINKNIAVLDLDLKNQDLRGRMQELEADLKSLKEFVMRNDMNTLSSISSNSGSSSGSSSGFGGGGGGAS